MLDRLPAWATCGVGSLPFDDPVVAADHACTDYDFPFCPQLPRLEGDMVSEWLGSDDRAHDWSPEAERPQPLAWDAFLDRVSRRPPDHHVVKLQITGPVTLSTAVGRSRGTPVATSPVDLAREISRWQANCVSGQIQALTEQGLGVLLVLDEPALETFGAEGTEVIWEPFKEIAPAWGLHLCCSVPWELVERAEPDLLSFDLARESLDRRATDALCRIAGQGRKIAWGVLAGHRQEGAAQASSRLRTIDSEFPGIGENSLITPSCGTGRLPPEREHQIAAALGEARLAMLRRP